MANCHCISNGCNPCYYFSRLGNSVSTWCSNGELSSETVRYAYLAQLGSLQAAEGEAIPLQSLTLFSQGFSINNNQQLYVQEPGAYRAEYTINLPQPLSQDTTFYLQAGNEMVPGSQITVLSGDPHQTITNQTILQTAFSTPVALYSSAPLSQSMPNAMDVAASLTLVKL